MHIASLLTIFDETRSIPGDKNASSYPVYAGLPYLIIDSLYPLPCTAAAVCNRYRFIFFPGVSDCESCKYVADFHQLGCLQKRASLPYQAWELFRCTPSRGCLGRRAAVVLMAVCFECGGIIYV